MSGDNGHDNGACATLAALDRARKTDVDGQMFVSLYDVLAAFDTTSDVRKQWRSLDNMYGDLLPAARYVRLPAHKVNDAGKRRAIETPAILWSDVPALILLLNGRFAGCLRLQLLRELPWRELERRFTE